MAHPVTSWKKAHIFSFLLFLAGLTILTLTKVWWPGIALVIGIPLALRQYLMGRRYDMAISLIVFIGIFITVQFNIQWVIILPILFTLGGIYIFFREFFAGKVSEAEEEEELNIEIKEEQEEKKDR